MTKYPIQWDLESLFPGRSGSNEFAAFLTHIEAQLQTFGDAVTGLSTDDSADYVDAILQWQTVSAQVEQARSFVDCLSADDMLDARAAQLEKRVDTLDATLATAAVRLESKLANLPAPAIDSVLNADPVRDIRFSLQERMDRVQQMLDPERESLIASLRVDGYQAWERMYYTLLGQMNITVTHRGQTETLSMGQAANKLSDPDRSVRQAVFPIWIAAWQANEAAFAETINHLAGFRLTSYRYRGWTNVLQEPAQKNRIGVETLSTLWKVVERNKAPLVEFLNRKARIMGVDRLEWYDFGAPLPGDDANVSFSDAAQFVVEQLRRFSPKMGEFADHALQHGWVEAENRKGKRTGAFCTDFPVSKESRVFMTFSGTSDNISTLAHELGHAFHHSVIQDVPYFSTKYPMGLAETASMFAEAIVADAALRATTDTHSKVILLDQKIQNAISMMMDIHCRFLFETRFYEQRRHGTLSPQELCDLMVAAQKEAFCDTLASYHPYFWASKLHFHDTGVPFYNFPYTIGYLFSGGLYARAVAEGPSFADRYVALLRDTGRMQMEELAERHLGVDLREPDFWQSAIDVIHRDIQEFLALTED